MLCVGLTGGMGSGKSLVAAVFRVLGIPVFEADAEGRRLTDQDPLIHQELYAWLGPGYFDGTRLKRQELAALVFHDNTAIQKLNSIIHPRVSDAFRKWAEGHTAFPYVIHEAAILFESGFDRSMDFNILVTCPEKIRIRRIMERDRVNRETALSRLHNQWTDDRKIPMADALIRNDGKEMIVPQIIELDALLKQKSDGKI